MLPKSYPEVCLLMEIFFCCTCGQTGTIFISRRAWVNGVARHTCSRCSRQLHQADLHFEVLSRALQRERINIVYRVGPLQDHDRARLREIHKSLGNLPPEEVRKDQVDMVLKRGSAIMALVRQEMQAEFDLTRRTVVYQKDNHVVTPEGFEPSSPA